MNCTTSDIRKDYITNTLNAVPASWIGALVGASVSYKGVGRVDGVVGGAVVLPEQLLPPTMVNNIVKS